MCRSSMGVINMPAVEDEQMVPAEAHGIQVMSIGFLVPDGEALVWRGPMLHKAIEQLLTDVAWGNPQGQTLPSASWIISSWICPRARATRR